MTDAKTFYYEYSNAVAPYLPTFTGNVLEVLSPNTTPIEPPAVTDETMIAYWLGDKWFVGKKLDQITASDIHQYIADVVFTRSTIYTSKKYSLDEIATFPAQYQAALSLKAGGLENFDMLKALADARGVNADTLATLIIAKHDASLARHIEFTKATYGLQASALESLSLADALERDVLEIYPLLVWLNDPKQITHKVLNVQDPSVSEGSNG